MVKNPPEGMGRITPYLFYKDLRAAVPWLADTFGFQAHGQIMELGDGKTMHAEMGFKGAVLMMGSANPEHGSSSPLELPAVNQSLYIYVDDVDAHYAHAKAKGAPNISEPMDMFWGDRMYNACDLEGHHWSFAQHIKDIPPEEMKPTGM